MLVHGFTQNARCWGPLADSLARSHEIAAVDLPGHGRSGELRGDLFRSARLLARSARDGHDETSPIDFLGYSLGGRVCLHLALTEPRRIRRLVVLGANPGIADPRARERRRRADRALADELDPPARGGDDPRLSSAHGPADDIRLRSFLERWLAGPLFATLPRESTMIDVRMQNTPRGLATSLRQCGTGEQDPLWDRLHELDMPVLFMAGELDGRFCDIGRRAVEAIGTNARLVVVPEAGHACHLERPDVVAQVVEQFLG